MMLEINNLLFSRVGFPSVMNSIFVCFFYGECWLNCCFFSCSIIMKLFCKFYTFSDFNIFSKIFKLESVPLITVLPPETCKNIGRLYEPSTSILTMSIWFSTLLYFTIFSIFWDWILLMIFSLLVSWVLSSSCISYDVILALFFLSIVVSILVLLSTISLCLILILEFKVACFWSELSLLDQMECMANLSRVTLIDCGRISST